MYNDWWKIFISYIIYNGRLLQKTLKENRISVNELCAEARLAGFADLGKVKYAILESNGKISILGEEISHILIADGELYQENLTALGYDEKWLEKRLSDGGAEVKDTFLMTVTDSGETSIIRREER